MAVTSSEHIPSVTEEALELRPRSLWLMPIVYAGHGLLLGGLSGAIAGTGLFPVFGTAYGLYFGSIAGLLLGIPIGGAVTVAIASSRDSARQALRYATTISMLGALAGCIAISIAMQSIAPLPAVIPAMLAAGYAANAALATFVVESQKVRFLAGELGRACKFRDVILASIAAPIVFWIGAGFLPD